MKIIRVLSRKEYNRNIYWALFLCITRLVSLITTVIISPATKYKAFSIVANLHHSLKETEYSNTESQFTYDIIQSDRHFHFLYTGISVDPSLSTKVYLEQ